MLLFPQIYKKQLVKVTSSLHLPIDITNLILTYLFYQTLTKRQKNPDIKLIHRYVGPNPLRIPILKMLLKKNRRRFIPLYRTLHHFWQIDYCLICDLWKKHESCYGFVQELYPFLGQGCKEIDQQFGFSLTKSSYQIHNDLFLLACFWILKYPCKWTLETENGLLDDDKIDCLLQDNYIQVPFEQINVEDKRVVYPWNKRAIYKWNNNEIFPKEGPKFGATLWYNSDTQTFLSIRNDDDDTWMYDNHNIFDAFSNFVKSVNPWTIPFPTINIPLNRIQFFFPSQSILQCTRNSGKIALFTQSGDLVWDWSNSHDSEYQTAETEMQFYLNLILHTTNMSHCCYKDTTSVTSWVQQWYKMFVK